MPATNVMATTQQSALGDMNVIVAYTSINKDMIITSPSFKIA